MLLKIDPEAEITVVFESKPVIDTDRGVGRVARVVRKLQALKWLLAPQPNSPSIPATRTQLTAVIVVTV